MPILNWIRMYDEKDPTQLSRTGKTCIFVDVAFERLQDEFIDTFGAGEDFLKIHKKEIQLELLLCSQLQTGDNSDQFFIDFLTDEIAELKKYKVSSGDVYECLPWIEHEMGFKINAEQVSVFQFYKYVKFVVKKVSK